MDEPESAARDEASLERPLPAGFSVEHGRDCYLDENGFSVAAYDEPRTEASFWGFRFTVPNTPRHRWAIMLHDLHHVATGYGTDPAGEGEISAWELRRGLRPLGLYVSSIVLGGALLGLAIAPRRTLRAFRASRPGSHSLFHERDGEYAELITLSVAELRERLAIPPGGLAQAPRGLHGLAPRRATR